MHRVEQIFLEEIEGVFSYSTYERVVRGIRGLIIESAARKQILNLNLATKCIS